MGQGTLYRHFPSREALLAEVYRRDVEELVAAASALLAEHDPPGALARWFDRVPGKLLVESEAERVTLVDREREAP